MPVTVKRHEEREGRERECKRRSSEEGKENEKESGSGSGALENMTGEEKEETNKRGGRKGYLMTSPVWSLNSMVFMPASTSHSMQLISPLEVKI